MKALSGRVAVVTGGASGIGLAMAKRLGSAGMRVVIADIEEPALDAGVACLTEQKIEVLAVPTDVADQRAVDDLAAATGFLGLDDYSLGADRSHERAWSREVFSWLTAEDRQVHCLRRRQTLEEQWILRRSPLQTDARSVGLRSQPRPSHSRPGQSSRRATCSGARRM